MGQDSGSNQPWKSRAPCAPSTRAGAVLLLRQAAAAPGDEKLRRAEFSALQCDRSKSEEIRNRSPLRESAV
jgi:hypothetical protein